MVWFLGCSRTDNYILSQEDKAEPNYISVDEALRMIQDKYKNAYLDYQFTFDYISNFYEKESYLGYFVRDIAVVYQLTGDEKAKMIVDHAFRFICSQFKYKGRIIPLFANKSWNRDAFARDCRLFYEAYSYTHTPEILIEVEQQLELWCREVKRDWHNGFLVFPYGMDPEDTYYDYLIDPNQNIVIAWLCSELYWCSESRFYKSAELRNIVYNEVGAALSLMDASGRLSLAEHLPLVFDSNYGGDTSTMLYAICQFWNEPVWIEAVRKMGNWLYTEFPQSHPWNTKEDYPNYSQDRFYPSNLTGRIPAFYAAGVDSGYTQNWIHFVEYKFPHEELKLELLTFNLKSLPSSYYLKNQNKKLFYTLIEPLILLDEEIRIVGRYVGHISVNEEIVNESVFLKKGKNHLKVYVTEDFYFEKIIEMEDSCHMNVKIIDENHSLFAL